MVTPVKTWYIDPNVVPASTVSTTEIWRRNIYNIKAFLTGTGLYDNGSTPATVGQTGNLIVKMSADGLGGFNASGDLWTSKAAVNQQGANLSWIVLETAAGWLPNSLAMQILISCATAGDVTASFSYAQVNNGGGSPLTHPFTGGSATTAPTLPTNGVGLGAKNVTLQSGLANNILHALRSSEGDFILGVSRTGSLTFCNFAMWAFNAESGEVSNNSYPLWAGAAAVGAGRGGFAITSLGSNANNVGWSADGTASNTSFPFRPFASSGGNDALDGFGASGGVNGLHPRVPIDIWQVAVNKGIYQGRVPDIRWTSQNIAINTLEPGLDPIRYLSMGDILVLTNGGTTWSL